jgi:Rieske Fe-S protein
MDKRKTSPLSRVEMEAVQSERRRALKLTAVSIGALGMLRYTADAFADEADANSRPQPGDRLVRVDAAGAVKPLRVEDIPRETRPLQAFPFDAAKKLTRNGSRLNKVLLLRLPPESMDAVTRERAADGVVAYSSVCTHQGCEVSEWMTQDKWLLCFCHFSKFNPAASCEVMGGPAPRSLPALALKSENGELVVVQKFSSAPGPRNT